MMIHVAEASGISPDAMRDPSGLASTPQDLVRDDTVIPWKDLTVLAARVGSHFGNSEYALHDFGRSYYRHLEHLPYTRLASNILTLRGALYLAQRYTTPHNYEALTCSCRWLSRTECIKTNSLKYPADPHSEVICHITFGILEHFPTLFGRDPMKSVEMEIHGRDASYHFTLPEAIGARKFFSRAVDSITRSKKNWEILKVQESRLVSTQWDARRRQGILDELLSKASQPLALLENGNPVFLNRALSQLLGGDVEASRLPFPDILGQLRISESPDRMKFSATAGDGAAIPLEAILSARISADSFGSEMTLLRFRDRRLPETREEAVALARRQERESFSRDLHDGLGQTLSGIGYRIAALRQAQPDDIALAELEGGVRSALAQARVIAHETGSHSDLSLAETLRLATIAFAGLTSISIDFKTRSMPDDTTAIPTHDIDMILREALANAVRHSNAGKISVSIGTRGNNLELEIRDDGTGIPRGNPQGFGMKSILTRAETAKGTAAWLDGKPGTLVRCTFPFLSP